MVRRGLNGRTGGRKDGPKDGENRRCRVVKHPPLIYGSLPVFGCIFKLRQSDSIWAYVRPSVGPSVRLSVTLLVTLSICGLLGRHMPPIRLCIRLFLFSLDRRQSQKEHWIITAIGPIEKSSERYDSYVLTAWCSIRFSTPMDFIFRLCRDDGKGSSTAKICDHLRGYQRLR